MLHPSVISKIDVKINISIFYIYVFPAGLESLPTPHLQLYWATALIVLEETKCCQELPKTGAWHHRKRLFRRFLRQRILSGSGRHVQPCQYTTSDGILKM